MEQDHMKTTHMSYCILIRYMHTGMHNTVLWRTRVTWPQAQHSLYSWWLLQREKVWSLAVCGEDQSQHIHINHMISHMTPQGRDGHEEVNMRTYVSRRPHSHSSTPQLLHHLTVPLSSRTGLKIVSPLLCLWWVVYVCVWREHDNSNTNNNNNNNNNK